MYSPRLLVHVKEVQENEEGENWERQRDDLGMEVMEEGQQRRMKRGEKTIKASDSLTGRGHTPEAHTAVSYLIKIHEYGVPWPMRSEESDVLVKCQNMQKHHSII